MVQQQGPGGGRGPINVNVDRATVARAEVTRMSMAGDTQGRQEDLLEELSKRLGPGNENSIKQSIDAVKAAIDDCCRDGGGMGGGAEAKEKADKSAAAATEGASTAMEDLQKSLQILISNTQQLSVGAGDAGANLEEAGKIGLATQKTTQKQYEALDKVLFEFKKQTKDAGDEAGKFILKFGDARVSTVSFNEAMKSVWASLKEAQFAEMTKALNQSVQGLQNFYAELTDMSSSMRKVAEQIKQDFGTARSGMITTVDLFTSELQNIGNLFRGEFTDSTRMAIETLNRIGGSAGLAFGRTIDEQARILGKIADSVEDDRLQSMIGFEGIRDSVAEQMDLARKRGLRGDQAELFAEKRARRELNMMANIMQNTGMTADSVKQLIDQETESLENLAAAGAINEGQLALTKKMLASTLGQHDAATQMLKEAAAASFQWEKMDENMVTHLTALSAHDEFRALLAEMEKGSAADDKRVVELGQRFGRAMEEGMKANPHLKNMAELMGTTNEQLGAAARGFLAMEDLAARDPGKPVDPLRAALDELSKNIARYFPTAIGGLVTAIGLNIAALYANTAALMGSWNPLKWRKGMRGGGGGPRGGPGGPGPRGQRTPRWSGRTPGWSTTPGAQAGTQAARGGAMRAVGSRAAALGARALPALGTAGAVAGAGLAGYGVGTLLNESLTNEEGRRMSDWVSDRLSDWFGPDVSDATKTVTIDDVNRSRAERGLPPLPDPAKKAAAKDAGPGAPTVAKMNQDSKVVAEDQKKQSTLLEDIRVLLTSIDRSNQLVADRIGMGPAASPVVVPDIQTTARK